MTSVSIHAASDRFRINNPYVVYITMERIVFILIVRQKEYWINAREGSKVVHGFSDAVPPVAHIWFFFGRSSSDPFTSPPLCALLAVPISKIALRDKWQKNVPRGNISNFHQLVVFTILMLDLETNCVFFFNDLRCFRRHRKLSGRKGVWCIGRLGSFQSSPTGY